MNSWILCIGCICLQKKHSEHLLLNDRLMGEISELKQEVLLIREIPQRLCESVASYKEIYKDVLLTLQVKPVNFICPFQFIITDIKLVKLAFYLPFEQSFIPDDESSIAKLLSSTSDICISLFSNLETNLSMAMDGCKSFPRNDSPVREECKVLSERLKGTITSLVLSETLAIQNKEVKNPMCGSDNEVAAWSQSIYHLSIMVLFFILMFGYVVSFFKILII